jgi:hypothetical protein
MGRKKKTEELTIKHRAILASFVFCPVGVKQPGRRSYDIARTNITRFRRIFQARKYDHSVWLTQIAAHCKALVRRGYLYEVDRVPANYTHHDGHVYEYQSPRFNLTEAGVMYCLTHFDEQHLIDARRAFKMYQHNNFDSEVVGAFDLYFNHKKEPLHYEQEDD